ncbi:MAG: transcriptional regulator [Rhodobacteraceae bacterium]|nr:transcriptional regulator [Paracoccaceae bacterium]
MSERTKTRLLLELKVSGPQTAADLAQRENVTPVAVRQHLDSLLAEGLVSFADQKGAVGRPKRFWSLSAKGHSGFPDNHSTLALGLMDGVRSLYGAEGIDKLVDHREEESFKTYSAALSGKDELLEKLATLAHLRSGEGYMAEVVDDPEGDGFLLVENHCSICSAARACEGFCKSELRLFTRLLGDGVEVTREEHLLAGNRRCVYRVVEAA